MGCDIHCVLQKENKDTGKFETVLYDVFPIRDYALFTFLSGVRGFAGKYDNIAQDGLPDDFKLDNPGTSDPGKYHNKFYMGEHTFGHVCLQEFCDSPIPEADEERNYEISQHRDGYSVTFLKDIEIDPYHTVRCAQIGLQMFFDPASGGTQYGERYRLVFGYDS